MWAITHRLQKGFHLRSWTPGCGDLPVTHQYDWTGNIEKALKFNSSDEALTCIDNHDMRGTWLLVDVDVLQFYNGVEFLQAEKKTMGRFYN